MLQRKLYVCMLKIDYFAMGKRASDPFHRYASFLVFIIFINFSSINLIFVFFFVFSSSTVANNKVIFF